MARRCGDPCRGDASLSDLRHPTPTQLDRRAALPYFLVLRSRGRSGIARGQGASSSAGTRTRPSSTASPTKAPSPRRTSRRPLTWTRRFVGSHFARFTSLPTGQAAIALPLAPHSERPGVRTYFGSVSLPVFLGAELRSAACAYPGFSGTLGRAPLRALAELLVVADVWCDPTHTCEQSCQRSAKGVWASVSALLRPR